MITNLFRSIIVAFLIPFTFACTGMSIFIANSAEMPGTVPALIPALCGLVGIVASGLFFVQLPFLFVKKHWFPAVNSLLLGCGFLLWLQANVFNWNFGQLDGGGVDWAAFRHLMVLEIVVYVAVVGLIVWRRQLLSGYAVHFACLLILMQAAPLAKPVARETLSMRTKVAVRHLLGFKTTPKMYEIAEREITPQCPDAEPVLDPNIPAWKQYEIAYNGFFDYSPERNVVLIIPDMFSSRLFPLLAEKHPEIREWFSDFNYFPKQMTQVPGTIVNIPQMLTAAYNDSEPMLESLSRAYQETPDRYLKEQLSLWNSEGALQKTLADGGFRTRLYTWTSSPHHWDHHWISNIRLKGSTTDHLCGRTRWDDLIETGIGYFVDLAVVRSVPIVCKPADIEQFCPLHLFLRKQFTSKTAEFEPIQGGSDHRFVRIMNDNPASAKSDRPILNIAHLKGAHYGYNFNENFEEERMSAVDGEVRQAFAILRLIKCLIDDMKKAGVYDNSLIVIAADHGSGYEEGHTDGRTSSLNNPLLLVKRQNERHEATIDRTEYTSVSDISPTILDLVGLKKTPGRFSIFNMPPGVLTQRETEYEALWTKKDKEVRRQVVQLKQREGTTLLFSSELALKRSDLYVDGKQLRLYVADSPEVWSPKRAEHDAVIVMTPLDKRSGCQYQGTIHSTHIDSRKFSSRGINYWFCRGTVDVTNVVDGEYSVAFMLPEEDGSHTGNILGEVAVVSGVASIVSDSSAVASKVTTVQ